MFYNTHKLDNDRFFLFKLLIAKDPLLKPIKYYV